MKPQWGDLPTRARYLAQEANGAWYHYEFKPIPWYHGWWKGRNGGRRAYCGYSDAPADHRFTLERRP